jgi:hypothetical protein
MLPNDYPRSAPFVRIVNRNPDYHVDPFYVKLQSKSDKSSYILNEKLNSVKNWHPSNSLVPLHLSRLTSLLKAMKYSKLDFPLRNLRSNRDSPREATLAVLGINCTIITRPMEVEGDFSSRTIGALREETGLRSGTTPGEAAGVTGTSSKPEAGVELLTKEVWEASWAHPTDRPTSTQWVPSPTASVWWASRSKL